MKKVLPEMNPGARLLIVGEAPGETEELLGKPFQGKSGIMLDNALLKAGLRRSAFIVANVCNYRPPNNEIAKVNPNLLVEGRAELWRLIEEEKPLAILLLGGTALEAVLDMKGIMDRRGSVYAIPGGIPVIPTLHPAAVLRDPVTVPLFMHDLKRFAKLAAGGLEGNKSRELVINPTIEQLAQLRQTLSPGTVVACDIETDERQLACVGFAPSPEYSICVPATTPEYRAFIRETLANPALRLVFHNSPYDLGFLRQRCGYVVAGEIEDTLAQHQALYPELPRSLATLTSLYTLQPYYKDMYSDWTKEKDYDNYYRYNALDCSVTREIWTHLDRQLDASGLRDVYERTRRVIPHAVAMSCLGMRYDQEEVARLRKISEADREAKQARLEELVGHPVNVYSPKQVADLLYRELRIPAKRKRDTGNLTTSEKVLMSAYATIPDPKIREVLDCVFSIRGTRKFISTYLNAKVSADGRMRSSFNPSGTDTGRWSASMFLITEGTNFQNSPPIWRSCIIADPGMTLWMADYSQIEARFVAYLAEDRDQIRMFETGGDIHKFNASRIFGVAYEDVTDDQRQTAKRCVHALNYGIGPQTLMETINKDGPTSGFWLTLNQAKKIRSDYLEKFVPIVQWQERTWKQIQKTRTVTNPFGRRRVFLGGIVDKGEAEHTKKQAIAQSPQSTVPDMLNMAIEDLRDHPPCPGFEVALQIHDAIGGWGPTDQIDVWLPAIKKAMDIPVPFPIGNCHVPVDIKVGQRWSTLEKVKGPQNVAK